MNVLGRKDILLIVILFVSGLFLAVSRPDDMNVRELMWSYTFMLIFFSVGLWFLNEVLSWLVSAVTYDAVGKTNFGSMSKNGLVVLAEKEGIADRKTLESLTEGDILMLLDKNGASKKPVVKSNIIIAIFKYLKEFVVGIVVRLSTIYKNLMIKIRRFFKKKGKR